MAENYVRCLLDQAEAIAEQLRTDGVAVAEARRLQNELIRLLGETNRAIRQGVLGLMKQFAPEMSVALIESLRLPVEPWTDGALLALADLNRWGEGGSKRRVVAAIEPFLDHGDLRQPAMGALRMLNSAEARRTMRRGLDEAVSAEDLLELSLTRDAELVRFFLERSPGGSWESKDQIPFHIASLVDAGWVADHLHEPHALLVAERFGYLDVPVIEILRKGASGDSLAGVERLLASIGLVSGEMLSAFLEAGPSRDQLVSLWEARVQEIANHLLPDDLIAKPGIDPIGLGCDSEDRLSRHLLFAGLRLADTWSFEAKLALSPFQSKAGSQVTGGFYFKSFELFEGAYLSKAIQLADSFFEPADSSAELKAVLMPYLVLNYALIGAETRADESLETNYLFEGRWRALVRVLEIECGHLVVGDEFATFVGSSDGVDLNDRAAVNQFVEVLRAPENQHLMRFGLLDPGRVARVDHLMEFAHSLEGWVKLSYGARAALKVFAYQLTESNPKGDLTETWLVEFDAISTEEARLADCLPSLGIEIQSTSVPEGLIFTWKEALEYFGIPSPRRPEFHGIVEAAFPPLYSPRASLLLLKTLHAWGIHENYSRGSAMHYSVAGDLEAETKYLAIGLRSFVTEKSETKLTENEWARSMMRVMSKGLIHKNPDSVSASAGEDAPSCHTEMRVLRLQNEPEGSAHLDLACDVFVPGGQGLAGAALAYLDPEGDRELAEIWVTYRDAITSLYLDPRYGQAELLEADWFEATGDPEDPDLVGLLPLIGVFAGVRTFFKKHPGRAEELRMRTNELFCRAAEKVLSSV